MKKTFSLVLLTFKEGVRDKALIGIGLFSFFMMAGSLLIVSLFMRELHKVALDVNLAAITFAGLLLTFFVSINLMAKDMDKHTIHCVLSKPFSRTQYIIGKYLGIMMIIAVAFLILTVCSTITIFIIKSQFENWFTGFAWAGFFKSVYAEFLMLLLLNAIIVFYSTITTSSFITLLFSITTYIAGQTIEEVVLYLKSERTTEMIINRPIELIIDYIQYILPNLSVFDIKIKAAHTLTISWTYMLNITSYSLIYSIILLICASIIFRRRELV